MATWPILNSMSVQNENPLAIRGSAPVPSVADELPLDYEDRQCVVWDEAPDGLPTPRLIYRREHQLYGAWDYATGALVPTYAKVSKVLGKEQAALQGQRLQCGKQLWNARESYAAAVEGREPRSQTATGDRMSAGSKNRGIELVCMNGDKFSSGSLFLTKTFGRDIVSHKQAMYCINRFNKYCLRHWGAPYFYFGVKEFQLRLQIHFHDINSPPDIPELKNESDPAAAFLDRFGPIWVKISGLQGSQLSDRLRYGLHASIVKGTDIALSYLTTELSAKKMSQKTSPPGEVIRNWTYSNLKRVQTAPGSSGPVTKELYDRQITLHEIFFGSPTRGSYVSTKKGVPHKRIQVPWGGPYLGCAADYYTTGSDEALARCYKLAADAQARASARDDLLLDDLAARPSRPGQSPRTRLLGG